MLLQKPSLGAPGTQRRGYLARLTVISTLGGLLFGYDTGVISGALLYMNDSLNMTSVEEATVVSALLFPGAAIGALTGGRMADKLGRRGSLLVCSLLFLFGAIGCAIAPNVSFMIAARILLGLGVGAAAVTCPLYLAEMAPAHLRGRMVTINELMIVTGQMLAFAINALLDALIHDTEVWRTMLAIASLPALALLAGMLLLPESPRWYAIRGRLEDSRRVLDLSRSPEEAAIEFEEIAQAAQTAKEERGHAWRDLRDNPWMRRLLWIGIGLATVQQATGINTVNYYAPTILEKSGLGVSASLVATIGVGVTSVLMTILGIWLLGFIGRRKMLTIGFSGVVGSQAAAGSRLPAAPVRSGQLHHPRGHDALCRFRPVLHRHVRVAAPFGDVPAGHSRLRHGNRSVRALDGQRRHFLPIPDRGRGTGVHRHIRAVRPGERCVPGLRHQIRTRNQGPLAGAARGALPRR
jgi:major inositol transporter-like SP family MFS transporter